MMSEQARTPLKIAEAQYDKMMARVGRPVPGGPTRSSSSTYPTTTRSASTTGSSGRYRRSIEVFEQTFREKGTYFALAFLLDSGYGKEDIKGMMWEISKKKRTLSYKAKI